MLAAPFSGPQDYRDIIFNNTDRQQDFFAENSTDGAFTYLSCPSQHIECTPGTIAASADSERPRLNHYTMFCPPFFEADSLLESFDKVANNTSEQIVMENFWGSQGYSFFHETATYGGTVAMPRSRELCSGAEQCWDLAGENNSLGKFFIYVLTARLRGRVKY